MLFSLRAIRTRLRSTSLQAPLVIDLTSLIFFLLLLVFYITFYRDCIYWDNARTIAYHVFLRKPQIPHLRYACLLVQSLAILASKLNASPKTITISYLVSGWLYYFAIFALLKVVMKSRRLSLAFILFICAGLTHGAIYPWAGGNSSAMSFLLAGLLGYKNSAYTRVWLMLGCFLCPVISVFFHPIGVFACLFVILYHLVANRFKPNWLIVIALTSLGMALVSKILLAPPYEVAGLMERSYLLTLAEIRVALVYLFQSHFAVFASIVLMIAYSVLHPKQIMPIYILGFIAVFLYVVSSRYTPGRVNWVAVWHGFGPIYAIVLIPLFYPKSERLPQKYWLFQTFIALCVLVWCAHGLTSDLTFMAERRRAIINIYNDRAGANGKMYWLDKYSFSDPPLNCLGLSKESALQVMYDYPGIVFRFGMEAYDRTDGAIALNSKASAATIKDHIQHAISAGANGKMYWLDKYSFNDPLLNCLGLSEESALQVMYDHPGSVFRLLMEGYNRTDGAIALNSKASAATIKDHIQHAISVSYPDLPRGFFSRGEYRIPVTIENETDTPLASRDEDDNPLQIAYMWILPPDGKSVWGGRFNTNIDVYRKYTQVITVKFPATIPDDAELWVSFYLNDDIIHPHRRNVLR